jgi:hypothetical protein
MVDFLKSWGSLLIATIALIQPWLIGVWKKFLRGGTVEIYETGLIEIGYSNFGATIGLHGTLRARDRDLFIRSVQLDIVSEKDQSKHRLEWGALRSAKLVVGRPEEMTLELPAGFMLSTSQPHRYNIQFHDTGLQGDIRPVLERLGRSWFEAVDATVKGVVGEWADPGEISQKASRALSTVYRSFERSSEHVEAFAALERLCYWNAGRYQLIVVVHTARPDRQFTRRWSFHLTDPEARWLRQNALKVVQEACTQYLGQYNFVNVRYEAGN